MGELIGVLKPDREYWGQTSPATIRSMAEVYRHRVPIEIGIQRQEISCYVDYYRYGNFTRFVRHSCKPNAEWTQCRVGDMRMMCLFSTRVINEGAEVTVSFGIEWLKEKGSCDCGLEDCLLKQQGTPGKK
jgi:hypothetical protein